MNSEINKSPDRTNSDDDNLTFGQLTGVESGLLDITCSGLLSSSENTPKKNDWDETLDEEVGEICSCIVEGCNIDNHHHQHDQNDEKNDNTNSSKQGINKTTTSPSVPTLVPVKRNLFSDTVNESQSNLNSNTTNINDERLPNTNNRNSSTYHPHHHSFGDSTQFYSIAGGNLHGFSDEEDDDEEHHQEKDELPIVVEDNESASSINSTEVVEINTYGRNVSFKANGNFEKTHSNEYLNADGDIDESQVHVGAIVVECNSLKRDKVIVNLLEALEKTVNEKEELIDQVNELQERLVNQQQSEDDVQNKRRESCSPSVGMTETYSSQSDNPSSNSEVEDLKLQITNLEKRLEADRKYLEAQTLERELERDDFQKTITSLSSKIEDTKKDKERLEILISNQKTELEDYELRLKETTDYQNEVLNRHDKIEDELKTAVEKIYELRDIIRSLEEQVDGSTQAVTELKEENKALHDDVERLEAIQKEQEKVIQENHETVAAANTDITEELQAQVDDLAKRLERKLKELDNCPWSTRPNSSCSSNAVSVSNEDISVSRDLDYINKDKDCTVKDVETFFADGLRKLDAQFESLVRFEEIIMKKLQDTELRLVHSKKAQEDLESDKLVLQEKINSQITIISDFENRLDQFRFEPSPSAVTLSGLRARVTTLTGTVEELKGQLHLKQIEMQDLQDRLAGKEALLDKLSMQIPESQPRVKKYSTFSQTEEAFPIAPVQKHSDTQTDKNNVNEVEFKLPKPTLTDASVQTKISKAIQYPSIEEEEVLDLSSIQGPAPPTHSTPNYDVLSVKGRSLRHKSATKFSDDFDLGRSPEVLREPVMNRHNNTVLSERLPNLNILKESENYTKEASEYPEEKRSREIDTYLNNQRHEMSVVKEEQVGESGQLVSESTLTSAQEKDKEGKRNHVPVHTIACQTPPLSLANLIEAINDEDKYDQLSEAKNSGQLLAEIIANKDQEIRTLQNQLEDLQTCIRKYEEELQAAAIKVQLCNAETNTDDKDMSDRRRSLSTQDSIEESDEANLSVVNWELLQNKNQGRKIETDVKVEVEVLKTQMDMLKQALENEKQKNSELQSQTIHGRETVDQAKGIKNLVSQERDRTLHMSILMEKQRDEITKLQKRLSEMEQLRDLSLSYVKTPNRNVATTTTNSFIAAQNANNCNNINESRIVGDNQYFMNQRQALKWQELYMRTKSYRKALSWQKKYLSIVITGYKDLLGISGALFEHPDYLQKEIPITPSSVGLCDHFKGKTRFRIYVRVVIATIRVRYMVSRWSDKQKKNPLAKNIPKVVPCSSSSQYASSSGSTDSDNGENIRKGNKFSGSSPPTKDLLTKKLKRNRSAPKRDLAPQQDNLDTRLSEFLERFETIEKGIEREFGSRKGKSEKIQLNK